MMSPRDRIVLTSAANSHHADARMTDTMQRGVLRGSDFVQDHMNIEMPREVTDEVAAPAPFYFAPVGPQTVSVHSRQ